MSIGIGSSCKSKAECAYLFAHSAFQTILCQVTWHTVDLLWLPISIASDGHGAIDVQSKYDVCVPNHVLVARVERASAIDADGSRPIEIM